MKQRTERFEMRLTPEEAAGIREKSKRYHSVSNFIRMAVNEFSDTDAKTRLECTTVRDSRYSLQK